MFLVACHAAAAAASSSASAFPMTEIYSMVAIYFRYRNTAAVFSFRGSSNEALLM